MKRGTVAIETWQSCASNQGYMHMRVREAEIEKIVSMRERERRGGHQREGGSIKERESEGDVVWNIERNDPCSEMGRDNKRLESEWESDWNSKRGREWVKRAR